MNELYSKETEKKWKNKAKEMLFDIGISPNLKGFTYIWEAVLMVLEDGERIHAITKEIYPDIAKSEQSKPMRIERAIRHAIASRLKDNDADNSYLPFWFGNINLKKITNGTFIAVVVERLKIDDTYAEMEQED